MVCLQIKQKDLDFGWGAVVNFVRKENPQNNPTNSVPVYVIDILLHVSTESASVSVQNYFNYLIISGCQL